ncbi:MAG: type II toxin-antitoxin system VapC family toxin [Gemmatimonadota bacterium]
MIVVDADVLVSLTLVRPQTELARQVFLKDADWAAPPLWRSDFRNALWKHLAASRISAGQAARAFAAAHAVIARNEPEPDVSHTLTVARSHTLEIYDAEYVAVAQELGVKYVTADEDLARSAPEWVVTLKGFCS